MYIVTRNSPCYPSVEYCGTLEKAYEIAEEFFDELYVYDGECQYKVTIAEVVDTRFVTSC